MNSKDQHVIIAANPKSGSGDSSVRVTQLREAIVAKGLACDVYDDLETVRARSVSGLQAGNLRAVVAAGGDGTAAVLANLLPAELPLLLFPMGTENLLAKHMGLTADVRQACAALLKGRSQALDVGSAGGKIFLVVLSCGFDARVVQLTHARRTGHITRWSYAQPVLQTMREYRFPKIPFRAGGDAEPHTAAWLFVFNVPRYGAALDFCPQADPTDGLLDICTFKNSGITYGMAYLWRLWWRSHQRLTGFEHRRCSEMVIEAPLDQHGQPMQDVPYQLDGDPGGVLPLKVEVLRKRLTLLQPAELT